MSVNRDQRNINNNPEFLNWAAVWLRQKNPCSLISLVSWFVTEERLSLRHFFLRTVHNLIDKFIYIYVETWHITALKTNHVVGVRLAGWVGSLRLQSASPKPDGESVLSEIRYGRSARRSWVETWLYGSILFMFICSVETISWLVCGRSTCCQRNGHPQSETHWAQTSFWGVAWICMLCVSDVQLPWLYQPRQFRIQTTVLITLV